MVELDEDVIHQTIDLQGLPRFEMTWGAESKFKELYGYHILLPEAPPDEHCINYGLPQNDQVFRRTFIPPQVINPGAWHEDPWTEEQVEHFIDTEYFRRKNGVWIFINGEKVWLPGPFYIFLNYWKLLSQVDIVFRTDALDLWYVWIDTLRDPNWDGLIDFKCRQIGDTEFVIFMIWEYATRSNGVKCPMQSCLGDEHIQKSYDRLVYGNKEMIWYMKPINQGTESPAEGLTFAYPVEVITTRKIKEQQAKSGTNIHSKELYLYPEIGSAILFGPFKERYFDGGTYGRAYIDEFGKAELFDPAKLLRVYQPAINHRLTGKQVGKIIMTSTVEEMKSGKSLKWAWKLWDQAKPIMKPTGMTSLNRMRRIFRSALDRAPVNRFGTPKRQEERKWIEEKSKEYLENGDMMGKLEHERSNPLTINQVFSSANDESQFDIDKLAKRQHYIHSEDYQNPRKGNKNIKPWVRGNLRWKDDNKLSGEAVWEPNSKGRWLITHHPKDFGFKENNRIEGIWRAKPGNAHAFRCGIDPYEQQKLVSDDWSLGGICVKRVLDTLIDGKEDRYYQFTDEARGIKAGDPVDGGINFLTNRICCTYLYRHANPEDFYEDCILTVLYYGTEFLPEKNKASGLLKHFEDRKYELYKMDNVTLTKNAKGKSEEGGVTATEKTIDEYFAYLMTLSCKWANTIDHPDVLEQMLTMNWKNRGQKDLGVAVGWCEYACKVPVHYRKKTDEQKGSTYYYEASV